MHEYPKKKNVKFKTQVMFEDRSLVTRVILQNIIFVKQVMPLDVNIVT